EEEYNAVCRPQFAGAYEAMKEFARECKRAGINCWFSVVDCIGSEKVEACRRIAEEVGIPLRMREMIDNRNQ
ncbi:MAG: radical SAM protein, partial [Clostridiales bacterium]|nr:radical SAM protein [Clostridiales bacterium]